MSLATEIEDVAAEPIEAVVIGDMGWDDYGNDERHEAALARKGEVLTWAEGRPLLDYEYDNGYGAPDCNAVWAWSTFEMRVNVAEIPAVAELLRDAAAEVDVCHRLVRALFSEGFGFYDGDLIHADNSVAYTVDLPDELEDTLIAVLGDET
jgi:hypothetical protein